MVPAGETVFEQEIKKSRFICHLKRVRSADEARSWFRELRKQYSDATHCCTAFKIGSAMGSSDDGEPSGTAGKPMLSVLAGSEADEIAAAVIRYFGGTLLGTGGLVRAYSSSVSEALKTAPMLTLQTLGVWQIRFDYALTGKVDSWLHREPVTLLERTYDEKAVYDIACSQDPTGQLEALGSGAIEVIWLGSMETEAPAEK